MKKNCCFLFIAILVFVAVCLVQQVFAANRPVSQIGIGQKLTLNGSQFVKINNDGLLMMTSTFACPHGKKIAGAWVECNYCDEKHGYYDYNTHSCTCNSGWNYRSNDHACIACPANSNWYSTGEVCRCYPNYYMQGDNVNCIGCPEHSSSPVGSTSINACSCDKGYYSTSNHECASCPPGSTTRGAGSASIDACVCGIGYIATGATYNCVMDTTNYSTALDIYYDATNCSNPIDFMNSWSGCASLAEHDTVCLADARDHRTYRVRKLADGKCWTVDSLRFGGDYGDIDGCNANNGSGNIGGYSKLDTFSTGYYGHCRAIPGTYHDNYYNTNMSYNNYLYDFEAAIQILPTDTTNASTYSGVQQGLCPQGWHIPNNNSNGEYDALLSAYYGTDGVQNSAKGNFTLSGAVIGVLDYGLHYQGEGGLYWSSTLINEHNVNRFLINYGDVYNDYTFSTSNAFAVRCIKD
ncbi:hypothetical protein IJJ27_04435 [bacterium]|nr:hypothetical protein [bacterium]